MHRFHCTGLHAAEVALPEEEAAHALRVLRLRDGDAVELVDGAGIEADGVLHRIGRHEVHVRIGDRRTHPAAPTTLHLAVAPTKQAERFEWFVEKAVEVGVERITPLATERTERGRLRTDRLRRVAVSAMKQSRRAWLPHIDELTTLDALLQQAAQGQRFVAHAFGEPDPLMNVFDPAQIVLGGGVMDSASVLLGPTRRWFGELLYAPHLRAHPELSVARFGSRAAAVGAALLFEPELFEPE